MSYSTKRIGNDDYVEIQHLIEQSFGVHLSLASIYLKYDTSIFGKSNVGLFALDEEGSPAAYYGVFPIILHYDSEDFIIAQSGDTMTAPAHRKKGLFTRLAQETYSLANEVGVKLIYGFPNKNSYPGFKKKLDWVFTGKFRKFTINVMTLPVCELASRMPFIEPYYNSYFAWRINKFAIDITDVNIEKFNYSKVLGQVKKDKNFLEYKLKGVNCRLVKINGFTILLKAKTHLYIGNIESIEESQVPLLLESVKTLAKKLACKKVVFLLSENHWLFSMLSKHVNSEEDQNIGFYLFDKTFDPNQIQFIGADFDTF